MLVSQLLTVVPPPLQKAAPPAAAAAAAPVPASSAGKETAKPSKGAESREPAPAAVANGGVKHGKRSLPHAARRGYRSRAVAFFIRSS